MTKKSKKDNKGLIIGCVCAVVAVIIVIVVAIVLVMSGKQLNDSYFVSDGEKYVLTIDTDDTVIDDEDTEYAPGKTHLVYYYSGDEITGMKVYYEYKDAETAKAALDEMKEEAGDELGDAEVDGKYVIITAPADQYEDLTASDVKSQIEFMETLKNTNLDDEGDEEEDSEETEEVEEVEASEDEE